MPQPEFTSLSYASPRHRPRPLTRPLTHCRLEQTLAFARLFCLKTRLPACASATWVSCHCHYHVQVQHEHVHIIHQRCIDSGKRMVLRCWCAWECVRPSFHLRASRSWCTVRATNLHSTAVAAPGSNSHVPGMRAYPAVRVQARVPARVPQSLDFAEHVGRLEAFILVLS